MLSGLGEVDDQEHHDTLSLTDILRYRGIYNQKGGNYNDVLPLKAARRDSISNLTSLGLQI